MRRLVLVFFVMIAGAGGYVLSPLVTAWFIKEAIKSGNASYLEHRVAWSPVKVSLKESLAEVALGPKLASAGASPLPKPSFWQRLKAGYGRYMVNSLVERYANPSGLPTLFSYGRTVRHGVLGRADPDEGKSLPERISSSWARVTRAEFLTPTRFAMEMRDKYDATRLYQGILVFEGLGWKLVDLRVKIQKATETALRLM